MNKKATEKSYRQWKVMCRLVLERSVTRISRQSILDGIFQNECHGFDYFKNVLSPSLMPKEMCVCLCKRKCAQDSAHFSRILFNYWYELITIKH